MHKESYPYTIDNEDFSYTFISVGHSGEILKIVEFQALNPQIYNLLSADYDIDNDYMDDMGI